MSEGNDDVFSKWRELLAAMPEFEGQPSAEQMEALRKNKDDKKAFLEGLSPDERKEAKAIEKEFKKQQKQKAQDAKPKLSEEEAAAKKKAAKERAAAKQAEAEAKQAKKKASEKARSMQKSLQLLCKWLGIKCELITIDDDETCFDVYLPRWLEDNVDYLDEYDLAEAGMTLDADELEAACVGGAKELAKSYFGQDFHFDFTFDNLVERVDAGNVLAKKDDLPPWYKHMTYPMTEAEIALAT